jgi:hypothetical protein
MEGVWGQCCEFVKFFPHFCQISSPLGVRGEVKHGPLDNNKCLCMYVLTHTKFWKTFGIWMYVHESFFFKLHLHKDCKFKKKLFKLDQSSVLLRRSEEFNFYVRVARWFRYCRTKNRNLCLFWRALEWKMLVYFMTIWNNSRPFGIFNNRHV